MSKSLMAKIIAGLILLLLVIFVDRMSSPAERNAEAQTAIYEVSDLGWCKVVSGPIYVRGAGDCYEVETPAAIIKTVCAAPHASGIYGPYIQTIRHNKTTYAWVLWVNGYLVIATDKSQPVVNYRDWREKHPDQ